MNATLPPPRSVARRTRVERRRPAQGDAVASLWLLVVFLNALWSGWLYPDHACVAQTWDAAGRRASLNEAGSSRPSPLFAYQYRADGRLVQVSAKGQNYAFGFADNGLLTSRTNPFRTVTINTRDGAGRITQATTAVGGSTAMIENQTWRDDGTLNAYAVTHTGAGAWNESRSYGYDARGQVTSEGFSPAPAASTALAYVFDGGTPGVGVRTDAKVGTGAPAAWQSSATTVNTLSRVTADQTNALGRSIPTNGVSLGADHVDLFIDGASQGRATYPGWADSVGAWNKTLTLGAGVHTLTANAVHPSGHYTATANATFTVNVANVTLTTGYDADGNVSTRSWSNGTTQLLTWDAFNRLIKVSQRDATNNGYDWTAVYDGLGRRLKTTQQAIAANAASGSPTVTTSIYDPQVEFLEIGVAVNGAKAWKVYGPDLNGVYGGLNGTGGLEATILDADGTNKGVINDSFGNGVASVSGGAVSWFATRVGGYGPLPGSAAEALTDITRVAEATAWRSRRIDPTGFYNLGARYYEPTSGRFLSPDPMGHAASMSLYDFANGDPVNGFDPDGRIFWTGLSTGEIASAAAHGFYDSAPTQNISNAWAAIFKTSSSVTGARIYAGIGVSILDGDIFDKPTRMIPGSQSISINGIGTNQIGRQNISNDVNAALGVNNTIGVVNDSHYKIVGDLIQIVGEELGAITKPSIDTANILQQMQGNISVVAHSQGSSIFAGAIALLPDDVRARIDYQGFGPQTYIDPSMYGLNSATNSIMGGDPVPFLSLRNFPFNSAADNFLNILEADGNNGIDAHFWSNYSQYVQNPWSAAAHKSMECKF